MNPSTCYFDNGNKKTEVYYHDDLPHREDGPALIEYYETGNMKHVAYLQNNKLHREDGPAYTWHYESGTEKTEQYYLNDEKHRTNGPSRFEYSEDGSITAIRFHKHGQELDAEAFEHVIDPNTGEVLDQVTFDLIYNML